MADFTIDTVSIEIEATANTASKTVDKLQEKVNKLTAALKSLKSATNAINAAAKSSKLDAVTAATLKRIEAVRAAEAKSAEAIQQAKLKTAAASKKLASQEAIQQQRLIQAQQRSAQAMMRTENLRERISGRRVKQPLDSTERSIWSTVKGYLSMHNAMEKIKSLGFLLVLKNIMNAMGMLVTKSNEYIENLNLFMVQMGDFSKEALDFVDLMEEKLGVDPSQSMRYMGFFMQIADSIGVASDKAFLLSKNLTLLSYDLSSFLNIDIETAMQKLRSGITGEIEPLRAVGYALSENTLQATLNEAMTKRQYEAYARLNPAIRENTMVAVLNDNMVGKRVRDLTEAQKVELRYVAIMNQATKAMGDMANTLNSPANQLRIFRQQLDMTARALGNIFIPILNKILPYLIAFAQIVREIATFIAGLFGFELPEVDYGRNIAGGVEDAAGAMDDLTDSTNKAKKAAKDLLAPFDELNIINENKAAGGGAGGGGVSGGAGALFDQLPDYTGFLDKAIGLNVDDLKDKLKDLLQLVAAIGAGIAAWKIAEALKSALPKIKEQFAKIKQNMKDIKDNGLNLNPIISKMEKSTAMFGAAVGAMVWRWIDLIRNSDEFREGLERINGVFETIKQAMGNIGSAIFRFIIEPLEGIVIPTGFVEWLRDIADHLKMVNIDLKDFAFLAGGLALIISGVNPVVGALLLAFELLTVGIRDFGSIAPAEFASIKEHIIGFSVEAVNKIQEFGDALVSIPDKVRDIKNNVVNGFRDALKAIKDDTSGMYSAVRDGFTNIVNDTKSKLDTFVSNVSSSLETAKSHLSPWFDAIGGIVKTGWEILKSIWHLLIDSWWNEYVKPYFTLDRWLNVFSAIKDAFDGTLRGALRAGIVLVNSFIDAINDKVRFEWPDIEIGGDVILGAGAIQLFTIPHIPTMFAKGGFPTAGDMFIANESGAEMVGSIGGRTAVANNDQIVAAVAQGVYSAMISAMSQQQQQPLVVELDGEVIYNNQKKIERARGLGSFDLGAFAR